MLEKRKCCLCGVEFVGLGHNPAPLVKEDIEHRCCNECNDMLVVPARLYNLSKGRDSHQMMTKGQLEKMYKKNEK